MSSASTADGLLGRARRWASRRVFVLCGADGLEDSREEAEEISLLVTSWRALGLHIEYLDWEEAEARVPLWAVVLPLLVWNYTRTPAHTSRYCRLMRALRSGGAQPQADLCGNEWIVHKKYLLALQADGLPVVPTAVLQAGTTDASEVRASMHRLRPVAERNADDRGRCRCLVVKPAVGGGGDGVERLVDDDDAEERVMRRLEEGDLVLQPFLARVRTRGELAFVYLNGALLHVVRKEPAGWDGSVRGEAPSAQPVSQVGTPPAEASRTARRALIAARRHAGATDELYFARVDLLPAAAEDEGEAEDAAFVEQVGSLDLALTSP